jgi:hypothetical protein
MNAETDATLRRIDRTMTRLVLRLHQLPPERRPGYLEARKRLQLARMRRARQAQ